MELVSEEKAIFKRIFEFSKEGIFVINKKGIIVLANPSAGSMFLSPERSFEGINIKKLIPDFDASIRNEHILDGVKKDSSKFSLKVRITHEKQDDFSAIVFISENSLNPNESSRLLHNEKKDNIILQAIPDLMFIVDSKGIYLDIHAPDPSMLVLPKEELIGKNIREILPEKLCNRILIAFKKSKVSGKAQILEYELKIEKSIKYFEARIVAKQADNFLAIIRDITYAKKKEILTHQMSVGLEMIATNDDISNVASHIVKTIEEYIEGCKVSVLKLESESNRLYTLVAPNLPKAYNDKINGLKIGPNVGSCGSAAFLKKEILVKDIANDMRWEDFRGLASSNKLEGCWSFPIFSKNEEVLGTFAIYVDKNRMITTMEKEVVTDTTKLLCIAIEHQKTQESLNESNRKYITLINNLPGVVYWCSNDKDWTMEYLNNNIEKLTGYKPDKFYGNSKLSFNSLIHPDDRTRVWEEVQKSIKRNKSFEVIYRIITAKNEEKWVWEQGAEIYNSEKQTQSLEGYIMDITERKEAEEILKENENRLKDYATNLEKEVKLRTNEVLATLDKMATVNLSLEGQVLETKVAESKALQNQELFSGIAKNFPRGVIVVISKKMEIVYCEGEALKDFELDEELVKGATLEDITFMDEDAKFELKDRIEKTLEGNHLSFEVDYFDQFLAVNTTPLYDSDKNITRALFVYNNITHQKQVELNIQKSLEQQKELNELKSRFVSMASHEFRTPLTAIMSSAILLGKKNLKEISDKKERYLSQINSNVQHMVSLLDDFLTISKLEEGKVTVTNERFNLIQFVDGLVEEFSESLGSEHSFIKSYEDQNIEIFHDSKLLRNILFNLLSNAVKYSSKNSAIRLIIKKMDMKFVLTVVDKGIGIPKKEQKNLFERFFRANNVSNIEGTGLGLNIVKQHLEIMGGEINYESKMNKGSSFAISLPYEHIA